MSNPTVTVAEPAAVDQSLELARYRAAIDGVTTNLMIADTELRITFVNQSLLRMLERNEAMIRKDMPQFSVRGLIGRCIDDFHQRPSHQRNMLKNLRAEHRTQLKLAGLSFDLIVTPARDADDQLTGFAVEWSDVTEKLKSEASLARLMSDNHRIKSALDGATTNVMIANEKFEIIYMNESLVKMMHASESAIQQQLPGFRVDGLMGTSIDRFHRNPAHQRELLTNLRGHHKVQLSLGGRFFSLIAGVARDEKGNVAGFSVEWVDITEQTLAQKEVERVLSAAVAGDLTERIATERFSGFLKSIGDGINTLLDSMADSFRQVKLAVEQIGQASTQLRATSQMMSSSSVELNSAAAESASSLTKAADMSKSNAENAAMANQLVSQTAKGAQGGQTRMEEMTTSMNGINSSAQQIAKIIKVIDEIAFQTNLLALNAAVEAARAGRHGKGFAVVAQEVRNLAERSAKAAKETAALIEDSVSKVASGVKIAEATREALKEIVTNVSKVVDLAGEIATASGEQSQTIRVVSDSVRQVTEGAQAGSQQSTEVAAAAEQMGRQMEILKQRMDKYKIAQPAPGAGQGALPTNLSPEMIEQVLRMIGAQSGAFGAASKGAAPSPAASWSAPQTASNGHGHSPKAVLPLDHDERGFKGF